MNLVSFEVFARLPEAYAPFDPIVDVLPVIPDGATFAMI